MGAIPIRRGLPLEQAALLGCAVATGVGAALFTARVQPGEDVVILGVGGVGLNIVQGARLANAHHIVAVDIDDNRLPIAVHCGASHVLNAKTVNIIEAVKQLTAGRGVEHVFEVVGIPDLMLQGLEMLARGGVLTLVGAAARDAILPFHPRRFMSQQQTIQGCIYGNVRPALDLPMFADWCKEGRLRLDQLPIEYICLEEVPAIFACQGSTQSVRTVIRFEENG